MKNAFTIFFYFLIQVKSNTLNIESLQSQVDDLKDQFQSLRNELDGLTIRVGALEASDTGTDPDLVDQVSKKILFFQIVFFNG